MTVASHTPAGHLSIVRSVLEAERANRLRQGRGGDHVQAVRRIDDALSRLDAVRTVLISEQHGEKL
jgi:hypothetical protein